MKRSRRLLCQYIYGFAGILTGATGLEPATSGVTGHFEGRHVDDGRHGIALLTR
jgi:hypothetical protein